MQCPQCCIGLMYDLFSTMLFYWPIGGSKGQGFKAVLPVSGDIQSVNWFCFCLCFDWGIKVKELWLISGSFFYTPPPLAFPNSFTCLLHSCLKKLTQAKDSDGGVSRFKIVIVDIFIVVIIVANLSHFHFLQNTWTNFNQTWHKVFIV